MAAAGGGVTKYVLDGFSEKLVGALEERHARIYQYVKEDKCCTRDELAKFIHGTAKKIREIIKPEDASDLRRRDAWVAAKGMLKEIIDFDKFVPRQFNAQCVKHVLEKKTAEVIHNYIVFVRTGEVRTKWFPPKLLGETDEILCVDKPCLFTCTYGSKQNGDLTPPPLARAESASALLNSEKGEIQIHEYLALKFHYECAVATRNWWAEEPREIPCTCGKCPKCAMTQSGCCNRLDKETSGVMICAKTLNGYAEIRRQFSSQHSLEKGGTEKYYLALCHGRVEVPEKEETRSKDWKHGSVDGRGRIEIGMKWSKEKFKSVAYDSGDGPEGTDTNQWALTLYDPIAWFTREGKPYTLVHVQIVTGRTHQIRFHLAEVGHCLVGDPTYGAPWEDREWAKRVFLHSYQTKFREPFTMRWFEATSPLPPDLGQILTGLELEKVKDLTSEKLLARREHVELKSFMKQYNPAKPLLFSHDPPVSAEAIKAAQDQMDAAKMDQYGNQNNGSGGQWSGGQSWNGDWKSGGDWKDDSKWKQESWNTGGGWQGGDWNGGGQVATEQVAAGDGQAQATAAVAATDAGGQAASEQVASHPPVAEQAAPVAANVEEDDDDDDDWGGWTAKATPGTKTQAAPAKPQQPARPPPPHLSRGGQAAPPRPAWQAAPPRPAWQPQAFAPSQPSQPPAVQDAPPRPAWQPQAFAPSQPSQPRPVQSPPPVASPPSQPPPAHLLQGNVALHNAAQPPAGLPGFPQEPAAKRPRLEVPVHNAHQAPCTPPAAAPPPQQPQVWRRVASRSQAGIFYYFCDATGETRVEPPPPWEKRQSRSQQNVFYYWNPLTNQTSVEKPEV